MKLNFLAQASAKDGLLLTINGYIGSGFWDADEGQLCINDMVQAINSYDGDTITVMINSCGGNYYAGVQAYNTLKDHKAKVITKVVGTAQSAASVIFCAGDERVMCKGSTVMMHSANLFIGQVNKKAAEKAASSLNEIDASMKSIYLATGSMEESKLVELMDAEQIINADDAVALGIATAQDDSEYFASTYTSDDLKTMIPTSSGLLSNFAAKLNPQKIDGPSKPVIASAEYVMQAAQEYKFSALACDLHRENFTVEQLDHKLKEMQACRTILTDHDVAVSEDMYLSTSELLKKAVAAAQSSADEMIGFDYDENLPPQPLTIRE